MLEKKGCLKVFNGNKFKIISYKNENSLITFTTSSKSNKYKEFKRTNKIKIKIEDREEEYRVKLIEDKDKIDEIFSSLKKEFVIPFFIPRKNKIIVQFSLNEKI